jgi:peptide/nickel transport system substrate-binding protein
MGANQMIHSLQSNFCKKCVRISAPVLLCVLVVLLTLTLSGCKQNKSHVRPGVLTVSQEQQSSWVRNFHPFLPMGVARWGTSAGIYEPLMIFNRMTGEYVPWLATSYEWGNGADALTFTIREGVRWSDGEPFSAADVVYSFNLIHDKPALDTGGLWDYLTSVELDKQGRVVMRFSRPYSPGLMSLAQLPIVPEHIWSKLEDPLTFTNPNPVATGPFTEILSFESQVYEIGRNPYYWKEGYPKVEALRFPAFPTNEQVTLALINGELDWAGSFVPAIDRIYVAKDPEHHGYWFPAVAGPVYLYASQKVKAFQDVRVRKALSMALDREMVNRVAMYNYTLLPEPAGLSDGYAKWRHPGIKPNDGWVHHAPAAAAELLDEAGYKQGKDGMRVGPDGEPMEFEISVIAGWSDWVRACQVMARNLRASGIDAKVKAYDFTGWFEKVQRGEFELSMGWADDGPTPYRVFRGIMANETVKPFGDNTYVNWHRYGNTEADNLLTRFERTVDFEEQLEIAWRLQEIYLEEAPAIPIFLNPSWGQYNTKRFVGWPNAENPYVRLSTNHPPEPLLIMTRLEPAPSSASNTVNKGDKQ